MEIISDEFEGYGFFYECPEEDDELYVACLLDGNLYWSTFHGADIRDIICWWEPDADELSNILGNLAYFAKQNQESLNKLRNSHPLRIIKNLDKQLCYIV